MNRVVLPQQVVDLKCGWRYCKIVHVNRRIGGDIIVFAKKKELFVATGQHNLMSLANL